MKVKKKDWQTLEELCAKIYAAIDGSAIVKHDDHIPGHMTETKRQIDVSIRTQLAGHDLLTIVQVRDRGRAPDINAVGELAKVMEDVCASKGVIVCRKVPGPRVIKYARKMRIDFCTVFDVNDRKWRKDFLIPVQVTYVQGSITPGLTIIRKADSPAILYTPRTTRFQLSNDGGKTSVDLLVFASHMVASREITASGFHRLELSDETLRIDVRGHWLPLPKLVIDLDANASRKFRYCNAEEYSAIKNYSSGALSIAKLRLHVPNLSASGWVDADSVPLQSAMHMEPVPIVELRLSELAESGGIGFNVQVVK